jgi:hypothetical protein
MNENVRLKHVPTSKTGDVMTARARFDAAHHMSRTPETWVAKREGFRLTRLMK